jgi:RHS repeat-associated protein
MSLSRTAAFTRAMTFFLAMLITQISLATDHGSYNKLSVGYRFNYGTPIISNTFKPGFVIEMSPEWIRLCDSMNRILCAPLSDINCVYRWQNVYAEWLKLAENTRTEQFMASYFLSAHIVVLTRNVNIPVYEAVESITFEPGFETAAGDQFETLLTGIPVVNPTPPVNAGANNADMNWIVAKAFDENGNVISEEKQFYDNGGRTIQSQSKMPYRKSATETIAPVFAAQLLRDAYGRDAATTLAAPINDNEFKYVSDFVRAPDGSVYSYRNFDRHKSGSGAETDKTNNPDAVGGQSTPGTLGWYYSSSNTLEPYTPTSGYPYARRSYYRDGTGAVKKAGATGEAFRMGAGHETGISHTPVLNELNHYIQVRNKFFSATEVGNLPSSLKGGAVQEVLHDEEGKEIVQVKGIDGKVLFTARPGNDLAITNTVSMKNLPHVFTFPGILPTGSGCLMPGQVVKCYGSGTILTISGTGLPTLTFNAPLEGVGAYFSGGEYLSTIKSDAPFTVVYADRQGTNCTPVQVTASSTNTLSNDNVPFHYFKILSSNSNVTITGDYTLIDMNTEAPTSLISGNKLNRGYYKVYPNNINADVTLTYTNSYSDLSYNYYNQFGQLIATIAPEGVKKILGSGINNYSGKNQLPFTSFKEYNDLGRLVKTSSTDGGISEFVQRNDGKIRFSQNAEQKKTGRFSYTNYDQYGRPVESGEYLPDVNGIQFNSDLTAASNSMRDILENVSSTGGLTTGTKTDVAMTVYDVPDNTHGLAYTQDPVFLSNATSVTRKYSSIVNNNINSANLVSSIWYNYDAEGNVIWVIKYINGLGYKTTNFVYDALGRLVKRVYQQEDGAETFVHYYEYDAVTSKLWKVYTNTLDDPSSKALQATYIYYLHGPLKRVELAGNLQGIDYTYTLQGSLKAINNSDKTKDPGGDGSNGFGADAFGMVLDYYYGDYINNRTAGVQELKGIRPLMGEDKYAGNLLAMTWFSRKPAALSSMPGIEDPVTYRYEYDSKDQFIESVWGSGSNFNITNINRETIKNPVNFTPAYDANGNMLYLQRTNSAGAVSDRLTYNYLNTNTGNGSVTDYNTNRLHSIRQNASGTDQPYAEYVYNERGQLINENTQNASQSKYIKYDITGKVIAVARDDQFNQKVVEFVYNEEGQRIVKKSYNNLYEPSEITYYAGDVTYTQQVTGGGTVLGPVIPQEYEIQGANGRLGVFFRQLPAYEYELSDHLGNVRAVLVKTSNAPEVRKYSDYYPYGMLIQPPYNSAEGYRYGYQGQYAEKDEETNWNSFYYRMYDSRVAKWLSVDPAGQFHSPYTAMGNDPVSGIDPDGAFKRWWQAKLFSWIRGGETDIYQKGDEWIVSYINTADPSSAPIHYKNFDIKKHLYVNFAGKATVGAQAGVVIKGLVELEGGYRVATLGTFSGGYSPETQQFKYDFQTYPVGTSVPMEDYFGVQLSGELVKYLPGLKKYESVIKNLRIGYKYKREYKMYHGYSGPREEGSSEGFHEWTIGPKSYGKKDWGDTKVDPLVGKGFSAKVTTLGKFGPENFVGIQHKFSYKMIFGAEVDLKIGFIW